MNRTPIDLQLLTVFAAVAEHESFSKAAVSLGVAKGTVSRSIAQLEEILGAELLHRTTHHVALSTAGAALFERTRAHLAALQMAVADLPERDEQPSGLLRLTAPPDFGSMVLPGILAAFSRRHPAVRYDIRLTSEHVDLVKEGFDLAIRVATGPLKDSSLTVRRLGKATASYYAAPSYLARRGRPRDLNDDRHTWVLHAAAARASEVAPGGVQFVVDDFFLARDLVREGVGIAVLPRFVAHASVRDGALEDVGLSAPAQANVVLLYPSSGQLPKKVAAFRDFVSDALRGGF